MDLLHHRVEQSQVILPNEDIIDDDNGGMESRFESSFGLMEGNCDIGTDRFEIGLGLGFELESGRSFVEDIGDRNIDFNNVNDFNEPDDDDFFVERRDFGLEFGDIASPGRGIRLITVESGSDDDVDVPENGMEIWGIDINEEDVYMNGYGDVDDEDEDDVSVTIPLCWDSLQAEERGVTNEEFEWEEVDGGVMDERELLSVFADADIDDDNDNSVSVSVSPVISLATVERADGLGNFGWEVLMNSHTLEINLDVESNRDDLYIADDHEDYIHTTEYEMLFEQFAEAEISSVARPPTSKSFIKNLPMILLDAGNTGLVCAVCKDEMNVGNKAARLPCNHKYHSECIVPWLTVRNTCPVCRHELPTDDAEYERRKSQRTTTDHGLAR